MWPIWCYLCLLLLVVLVCGVVLYVKARSGSRPSGICPRWPCLSKLHAMQQFEQNRVCQIQIKLLRCRGALPKNSRVRDRNAWVRQRCSGKGCRNIRRGVGKGRTFVLLLYVCPCHRTFAGAKIECGGGRWPKAVSFCEKKASAQTRNGRGQNLSIRSSAAILRQCLPTVLPVNQSVARSRRDISGANRQSKAFGIAPWFDPGVAHRLGLKPDQSKISSRKLAP